MKRKAPFFQVIEIVLKCLVYRRKGQFLPWHFMSFKEPYIQALVPGAEKRLGQGRTKHDVDLIYKREIIEGMRFQLHDPGTRFFKGLSFGPCFHRLAIFQKSRREGPFSIPRFNGPPTQQDILLPDGNRTDHHIGIFIVNHPAPVTYKAGAIIIFRYSIT